MAFRVVMVTDQQWLTWIISPVRDQTPKTQTKGTVAADSKGGLPEHVAWMLGTLMYAPLSHCASLPSCLYEGIGEKPMFSGYINSWWAWHHSVQSSKSFFFTPCWFFRLLLYLRSLCTCCYSWCYVIVINVLFPCCRPQTRSLSCEQHVLCKGWG